MSEEKRRKIRELLDAGLSHRNIAYRLHCSRGTIKKVKDGIPVRVRVTPTVPVVRVRVTPVVPPAKKKYVPVHSRPTYCPTPEEIATQTAAIRKRVEDLQPMVWLAKINRMMRETTWTQ